MSIYRENQARKVTITAKAPNEDITIREDGAAMVYAYVLPKVDLTVTAIELDDGKIIANPVTVAVANLKGNDRIEGTDQQKIVQAEPIKSFGAYEVKCKLGYEVTGTIHVLVIEDK